MHQTSLLTLKHIFRFLLINSFIFLNSCNFESTSKVSRLISPLETFIYLDNETDIEKKIDKQILVNKILIVNFWASWCGPCQQEMPSLIKLVSENLNKVILISINVDNSEKEMKKFISLFPKFKEKNIFLYFDSSRKWTQAYSVVGFPETFLYDKKHKFIKRFQGAIDFKSAEFTKILSDNYLPQEK